ncbi:hypothetical protein BCR35DRAFT_255452, partial [Leucosporidium creatinivorum]
GREEREWSHGLCECLEEPGRCIVGCCCPCIIYGKTARRLTALEETGEPTVERGELRCCSAGCVAYCLIQLTGCSWILDCLLRPRLRAHYSISGSLCGDCMITAFCASCARVQMAREVSGEEE